MQRIFGLCAAMLVALVVWNNVEGGEQKDVTITGKVTCAKCDLKKETKCMTVVVEKKDGKEAIYYFDAAAEKKFHMDICTEAKDGTVTGTVAEKDGKKSITVKEVKYGK
ncbi:MAG TPA: DUF6370 family protein [Gemmataceae bacterium]|nr:DUF6370 family protein [Gemmataceae bacterium]